MYHSIIFDDIYNTYDAWHLIPSSRPVMSTADVEYVYSSIPPFTPYFQKYMGRGVNIKRTGSWSFIVDNRYDGYDQPTLYSTIQNAIHGKVCKIAFEDDPDYYYIGKVRVNAWNPDAHFSTISIEAECDPFKYGEPVTQTITSSGVTVTNNGSFVTPAIVEVNFRNASPINTVTLTGLARDKTTGDTESIVVRSSEEHSTIIVNGESKGIYIRVSGGLESVYSDVDLWSFPSLKPGNNVIGVSGARFQENDFITLTYTPRYL